MFWARHFFCFCPSLLWDPSGSLFYLPPQPCPEVAEALSRFRCLWSHWLPIKVNMSYLRIWILTQFVVIGIYVNIGMIARMCGTSFKENHFNDFLLSLFIIRSISWGRSKRQGFDPKSKLKPLRK